MKTNHNHHSRDIIVTIIHIQSTMDSMEHLASSGAKEERITEAHRQRTEQQKRVTIRVQGKEARKTVLFAEEHKRKTETFKQKTAINQANMEVERRKTLETEGSEQRLTIQAEAQAEVVKETAKQETANAQKAMEVEKRKTLETQGSEQRLTIQAEKEAEVAKENAKQKTLALQIQLKQMEIQSAPVVFAPQPVPVLASPKQPAFVSPKACRKRSAATLSTTTTKSGKKGRTGLGFATLISFDFNGEGNSFPQPQDFTKYLVGRCNAGLSFSRHGQRQSCQIAFPENGGATKKSTRCETWQCGCGGVTLRIARNPHNATNFWIQRAESKPSLQYHLYIENGQERQGCRLVAKTG